MEREFYGDDLVSSNIPGCLVFERSELEDEETNLPSELVKKIAKHGEA